MLAAIRFKILRFLLSYPQILTLERKTAFIFCFTWLWNLVSHIKEMTFLEKKEL
jgi:hypothetical protein